MDSQTLEEKCVLGLKTCEKEMFKASGLISKDLQKWLYNYKGYMMQEDGYIDYEEWHASVFSVGLIGLAFTLNPPINIVPILLWFWVLKRVINDRVGSDSATIMQEIDTNLHYFLIHGIILILILKFGAGMSLGIEAEGLSLILTLFELLS